MLLADTVVAFLEGHGAKYVFGVPGSTTVSLIDSISKSSKIKFITSLNENASLGMADGYARASGEYATVVLHTTPGLSTALPNLYNSFVDNIPLLILVGDVNSKALIREPGLSLNKLEDLAEPVTRWCYYAKSSSDVLTATERCASILNSPQPGPCCIIIPEDILEQQVDSGRKPTVRNSFSTFSNNQKTVITPSEEQISRLVSSIDDAEWPVLIVGREIRNEKAIRSLAEFAERIKVPVLLESPYPSAYNVSFPQDHPCYLGLFKRESEAMKGADLVVGLGGQLFTERKFYDDEPFDNENIKVVHIQSNPWEIGKNTVTDVAIMGTPDIASIMLNEFSRQLEERKTPNKDSSRKHRQMRIEQIHSRRMDERKKLASKPEDGLGIKPWKFVGALYQVLNRMQQDGHDFTIVDEGVITSSYLAELFVFTKPGSLIGRSAGCLGWGVNAAIGARLARPDHKIVAFVGDGALMFCPQGLWTAAHYKIPITIVVCNNSGYSSVDLSYDSFEKRSAKGKVFHTGTGIIDPTLNIVKLAESLGVRGTSVTNEGELVSVLDKSASSSDLLELIDVHTDRSERGYEGSVGHNSAWT